MLFIFKVTDKVHRVIKERLFKNSIKSSASEPFLSLFLLMFAFLLQTVEARIGDSRQQLIERYGEPKKPQISFNEIGLPVVPDGQAPWNWDVYLINYLEIKKDEPSLQVLFFSKSEYYFMCLLVNNKTMVEHIKRKDLNNNNFSEEEIQQFLEKNKASSGWSELTRIQNFRGSETLDKKIVFQDRDSELVFIAAEFECILEKNEAKKSKRSELERREKARKATDGL